MPDSTIDFGPYLARGLRPHSDVPRNSTYTDKHQNLMACERRGKQLPAFDWPVGFPAVSAGWPLAEGYFADRVALSVVDNEFHTLDPSALTSDDLVLYQATGGTSNLANGTFTGNATGWTLGAGFAYGTNNVAATTASSTLKQAKASMATPWTNAKVYEVTFTITRSAGSLTVGTNANANQGAVYNAAGTYTALVTADNHADGLVFTGTGFTGTVDLISAIETYAVSGDGSWHFAAFQSSWFATNGTSLVYKAPSNATDATARVVGHHATFACNSVCNWNNRIVVIGPSGSRFADASWTRFYDAWRRRNKKNVVTSEDDTFGASWIIIGARVGGDPTIPNSNMLALLGLPSDTAYTSVYEPQVLTGVESGEYDLLPLRHVGTALRGEVYDGDLIVYGTEGVSRIKYTEQGPVEFKISPVGLWGRAAVGGPTQNAKELVSLGVDGNAYIVGPGAARYGYEGVYAPEEVGPECHRLGWSEYLGTLHSGVKADHTYVVYDSTEQRYWFSADDGAYLLTKTGLSYSLGVVPSVAFRFPGSRDLIGAAVTNLAGASAVKIRTVPSDGGRRDPFNMGRIDLSTTDTATDPADRWAIVPSAKLAKHTPMTVFDAVPSDLRGSVPVDQYGVEQQYEFQAADRTKVDLDGAIGFIDPPDKSPNMRKWRTKLGI